MSTFRRSVYIGAGWRFGRANEFAPDLGIITQGENGGEPYEPYALMFEDPQPDGGTHRHVFIFDEGAKEALAVALRSGIIVPKDTKVPPGLIGPS